MAAVKGPDQVLITMGRPGVLAARPRGRAARAASSILGVLSAGVVVLFVEGGGEDGWEVSFCFAFGGVVMSQIPQL